MEIRTLRYFLAVAREENMSRAAEHLHVTQPTLSKALKALEDELGKKLFTRHSFSIALTEEGVLLRNRAEDLVSMADKIEQEFLTLDDITGGDIYFGLAESYQIRYLAREIRTFKETYPGLKYHITSGDTEQVTEKLDKGLLDFAVICETPDERKYNYILFPEADYFGAIVPASSALAEKECITPQDLAGQPLFCSEQSWGNDIRPWAGDTFPQLHLELHAYCREVLEADKEFICQVIKRPPEDTLHGASSGDFDFSAPFLFDGFVLLSQLQTEKRDCFLRLPTLVPHPAA